MKFAKKYNNLPNHYRKSVAIEFTKLNRIRRVWKVPQLDSVQAWIECRQTSRWNARQVTSFQSKILLFDGDILSGNSSPVLCPSIIKRLRINSDAWIQIVALLEQASNYVECLHGVFTFLVEDEMAERRLLWWIMWLWGTFPCFFTWNFKIKCIK